MHGARSPQARRLQREAVLVGYLVFSFNDLDVADVGNNQCLGLIHLFFDHLLEVRDGAVGIDSSGREDKDSCMRSEAEGVSVASADVRDEMINAGSVRSALSA